jgi:undecaprenyl diphosphate synthase
MGESEVREAASGRKEQSVNSRTLPDSQGVRGVPAEKMPKHVAIIMDGNGRWAVQNAQPRGEGHRRGASVVREVTQECARLGIEQLTLYCFSSENWKRPREELDFLMHLLQFYLIEERPTLMKHQLRLRIIGRRDRLPAAICAEMDRTIEMTANNRGTTLCLAINYGGRAELVDAVRAISAEVASGRLTVEEIDESLISDHLYTRGMPDPDLLIRTAGEMRVSNFLLWQISYSELWVTQRFWPDFRVEDLHEAVRQYANRQRRYGGLNSGEDTD